MVEHMSMLMRRVRLVKDHILMVDVYLHRMVKLTICHQLII
jgi:hypothetical protein